MIHNAFAYTSDEIISSLGSNLKSGLSSQEVKKRRLQFGANSFSPRKPRSKIRILTDQFLDPIIYILTAAVLLALVFEDWPEAIAILVVILFTVLIGFFMELQAIRSLRALSKMSRQTATVLRNGKHLTISASGLVPGDIVLLNTGDVVPADARVLISNYLAVKESALTGESTAVYKKSEKLPAETLLSDQNNMIFKGTVVLKGNASVIITATGRHTQLGQIQQMGSETDSKQTPLEKKLKHLSKRLVWLTLILAFLVMVSGFIRGKELVLMIETGVALAVAAIPEGLPIITTIALARGMLKLSRQKVIIKTLDAVQTLGTTTMICTDKTGTLTEDAMMVHTLAFGSRVIEELPYKKAAYLRELSSDTGFDKLMMTAILCNSIPLDEVQKNPDSIDKALLQFAGQCGYHAAGIRKNNPERRQIPFDPEQKMMTTVNYSYTGGFTTYVKGAFEQVIQLCDRILVNGEAKPFIHREKWTQLINQLAAQGLRTLAFALKTSSSTEEPKDPGLGMIFLGIAGFMDPSREDVKSTIALYKSAGIRVVMLTGDHPGTAGKVAREVGLLKGARPEFRIVHGEALPDFSQLSEKEVEQLREAVVFARVTPKQKLDILTFYQSENNIIGMLGDGINDVPALLKADIGVAMGIRGTEAAREAADIILKDDKFTSMEPAIHQGRAIFMHIRQFVVYLMSSNLAEIISVGLAALVNLTTPLLPLQILYLNLITDIFPALAIGTGKGETNIMKLPPRDPKEPLITPGLWKAIFVYGMSITAAVLGVTAYATFVLKCNANEVNNMAFYTLILAQLLNVFNLPTRKVSFFKNEITTNLWIWAALVISSLFIVLAYVIRPVAEVLSLVPLTPHHLGIVLIFGSGALGLAQLIKRIGRTP